MTSPIIRIIHTSTRPKRHVPGSGLFIRLPLNLIMCAILAPIVALQQLSRIQVSRTPPGPTYRGTSTLSGRPLRTFQESLSDLDQETDPRS